MSSWAFHHGLAVALKSQQHNFDMIAAETSVEVWRFLWSEARDETKLFLIPFGGGPNIPDEKGRRGTFEFAAWHDPSDRSNSKAPRNERLGFPKGTPYDQQFAFPLLTFSPMNTTYPITGLQDAPCQSP